MGTAEVTLVFPDRQGAGRVGRIRLPWVRGKQLRTYMRDPVLLELGLVGFSLRCKMFNGQKQRVHLTYTPPAGDFVVLNPVKLR